MLCNRGPVEYFTHALCNEDVARFGFELVDPAGKASLRLSRCPCEKRTGSKDEYASPSVVIQLLTLVVNVRPRTRQLRLIGHELALDFAECSFVPVIAQHLPGVANTTAAALSRMAQKCS